MIFWFKKTVEIVYSPRGEAPEGCPDKDTYGSEHAWATSATRALAPSEELFQHLPQRVFLIAATQKHANKLAKMLLNLQVPAKDINIIGNAKCFRRNATGRSKRSLLSATLRKCITKDIKCQRYALHQYPNVKDILLHGLLVCFPAYTHQTKPKEHKWMGALIAQTARECIGHILRQWQDLQRQCSNIKRNAKNLEKALANIGKMDS